MLAWRSAVSDPLIPVSQPNSPCLPIPPAFSASHALQNTIFTVHFKLEQYDF